MQPSLGDKIGHLRKQFFFWQYAYETCWLKRTERMVLIHNLNDKKKQKLFILKVHLFLIFVGWAGSWRCFCSNHYSFLYAHFFQSMHDSTETSKALESTASEKEFITNVMWNCVLILKEILSHLLNALC